MDSLTDDQLMPSNKPVKLAEDPANATSTSVLPMTPKEIVFKTYIEKGETMGPTELAKEFDIPLPEVLHWFRSGGWVAERKRLIAAMREHSDAIFQEVVAYNRPTVAQEQLSAGKFAEEMVLDVLKKFKEGNLVDSRGEQVKYLTPDNVKKLMDALLTASTIRARAVGLSEKAAADAMAQAQAAAPVKVGLFVVGPGTVSAPSVPRDVTAEVRMNEATKDDE